MKLLIFACWLSTFFLCPITLLASDEEENKFFRYTSGGKAEECTILADGSEDCHPTAKAFDWSELNLDAYADPNDPLIKLMKENERRRAQRQKEKKEKKEQQEEEAAAKNPTGSSQQQKKNKKQETKHPKPKPPIKSAQKDHSKQRQTEKKPQKTVSAKGDHNAGHAHDTKHDGPKDPTDTENNKPKPRKQSKRKKTDANLNLQELLNSPSGKKAIRDAQRKGEQLDLSQVIGAALNAEFSNFGKSKEQIEAERAAEAAAYGDDDEDDDTSGMEMLLVAALKSAAEKEQKEKDPFGKLRKTIHPKQDEYFAKIARVLANFDFDDESDVNGEKLNLFLENLMSLATPDHAQGNPVELSTLLNTTQQVKQHLGKLATDIGLDNFHPLQFYYAMLHEEQQKNPVWKRRQHRYLPPLPLEEALQMADGLYLSQLAYLSDCDEIRKAVSDFQKSDQGVPAWEMRNCSTTSQQFEPAHFVMVQLKPPPPHDSRLPSSLEAALVIRGSQTAADFLSAGTLESVEYPGHPGEMVHGGMYQSAKWLYTKYEKELVQTLAEHRRFQGGHDLPMTLYLVGHSLGGAVAALASMEFNNHRPDDSSKTENDNPNFDAYAVGFGTPAVVSPGLSKSLKDRITTVICDADGVPRLSSHTLRKAWERVLTYNFTQAALDDVAQILPMIEKKVVPLGNWTTGILESMHGTVKKKLSQAADKQIAKATEERDMTPIPVLELIPPGDCVHFYRDGVSWQSVYRPCHQFDEIEVVPHVIDDHLIMSGYYPSVLQYVRQLKDDLNWVLPHDLGSVPLGTS